MSPQNAIEMNLDELIAQSKLRKEEADKKYASVLKAYEVNSTDENKKELAIVTQSLLRATKGLQFLIQQKQLPHDKRSPRVQKFLESAEPNPKKEDNYATLPTLNQKSEERIIEKPAEKEIVESDDEDYRPVTLEQARLKQYFEKIQEEHPNWTAGAFGKNKDLKLKETLLTYLKNNGEKDFETRNELANAIMDVMISSHLITVAKEKNYPKFAAFLELLQTNAIGVNEADAVRINTYLNSEEKKKEPLDQMLVYLDIGLKKGLERNKTLTEKEYNAAQKEMLGELGLSSDIKQLSDIGKKKTLQTSELIQLAQEKNSPVWVDYLRGAEKFFTEQNIDSKDKTILLRAYENALMGNSAETKLFKAYLAERGLVKELEEMHRFEFEAFPEKIKNQVFLQAFGVNNRPDLIRILEPYVKPNLKQNIETIKKLMDPKTDEKAIQKLLGNAVQENISKNEISALAKEIKTANIERNKLIKNAEAVVVSKEPQISPVEKNVYADIPEQPKRIIEPTPYGEIPAAPISEAFSKITDQFTNPNLKRILRDEEEKGNILLVESDSEKQQKAIEKINQCDFTEHETLQCFKDAGLNLWKEVKSPGPVRQECLRAQIILGRPDQHTSFPGVGSKVLEKILLEDPNAKPNRDQVFESLSPRVNAAFRSGEMNYKDWADVLHGMGHELTPDQFNDVVHEVTPQLFSADKIQEKPFNLQVLNQITNHELRDAILVNMDRRKFKDKFDGDIEKVKDSLFLKDINEGKYYDPKGLLQRLEQIGFSIEQSGAEEVWAAAEKVQAKQSMQTAPSLAESIAAREKFKNKELQDFLGKNADWKAPALSEQTQAAKAVDQINKNEFVTDTQFFELLQQAGFNVPEEKKNLANNFLPDMDSIDLNSAYKQLDNAVHQLADSVLQGKPVRFDYFLQMFEKDFSEGRISSQLADFSKEEKKIYADVMDAQNTICNVAGRKENLSENEKGAFTARETFFRALQNIQNPYLKGMLASNAVYEKNKENIKEQLDCCHLINANIFNGRDDYFTLLGDAGFVLPEDKKVRDDIWKEAIRTQNIIGRLEHGAEYPQLLGIQNEKLREILLSNRSANPSPYQIRELNIVLADPTMDRKAFNKILDNMNLPELSKSEFDVVQTEALEKAIGKAEATIAERKRGEPSELQQSIGKLNQALYKLPELMLAGKQIDLNYFVNLFKDCSEGRGIFDTNPPSKLSSVEKKAYREVYDALQNMQQTAAKAGSAGTQVNEDDKLALQNFRVGMQGLSMVESPYLKALLCQSTAYIGNEFGDKQKQAIQKINASEFVGRTQFFKLFNESGFLISSEPEKEVEIRDRIWAEAERAQIMGKIENKSLSKILLSHYDARLLPANINTLNNALREPNINYKSFNEVLKNLDLPKFTKEEFEAVRFEQLYNHVEKINKTEQFHQLNVVHNGLNDFDVPLKSKQLLQTLGKLEESSAQKFSKAFEKLFDQLNNLSRVKVETAEQAQLAKLSTRSKVVEKSGIKISEPMNKLIKDSKELKAQQKKIEKTERRLQNAVDSFEAYAKILSDQVKKLEGDIKKAEKAKKIQSEISALSSMLTEKINPAKNTLQELGVKVFNTDKLAKNISENLERVEKLVGKAPELVEGASLVAGSDQNAVKAVPTEELDSVRQQEHEQVDLEEEQKFEAVPLEAQPEEEQSIEESAHAADESQGKKVKIINETRLANTMQETAEKQTYKLKEQDGGLSYEKDKKRDIYVYREPKEASYDSTKRVAEDMTVRYFKEQQNKSAEERKPAYLSGPYAQKAAIDLEALNRTFPNDKVPVFIYNEKKKDFEAFKPSKLNLNIQKQISDKQKFYEKNEFVIEQKTQAPALTIRSGR